MRRQGITFQNFVSGLNRVMLRCLMPSGVLSSWVMGLRHGWQVEHGGGGLLGVGETTQVTDRGRQVELSHLDGSPRSLFGRFMAAMWDLSRRFGGR